MGHGINIDLICDDKCIRGTQNIWMIGGGHAGLITPEALGVLATGSGGGYLLALPRGVMGGRVLLHC